MSTQDRPDGPDHVRLLLPSEVAARIGVHRSTLYSMWRRGEGPPWVQVAPRRRRSRRTDVDLYVRAWGAAEGGDTPADQAIRDNRARKLHG